MGFNGLCHICEVASEYKYLQETGLTSIHSFKGVENGLLLYFIASEYPTLNVCLSFNCESVLESLERKSHVTALDPSHP